jgi:hypothetical protein
MGGDLFFDEESENLRSTDGYIARERACACASGG